MKEYSIEWYAHMHKLFTALYISEPYETLSSVFTGYWSTKKPYLKAKSVVMFDRTLNGEIE